MFPESLRFWSTFVAVGGNHGVFASHDFGSWSLEDVEKIRVAIKGSCDFSPGFFWGWQHKKIQAPFTSLRIVIIKTLNEIVDSITNLFTGFMYTKFDYHLGGIF